MSKQVQSVEPNIADLVNRWLRSYNLDYKLEQESLNSEIDQALNDYYSKMGGSGGNRPDAKLLLRDKNLKDYPILIEYKGYKGKLVKLDSSGKVVNKTQKNQPDYKVINEYAVNGAVHYSNALLHYTSYTDIIAIGVTGYKDSFGNLVHEIGVYYVSKSNYGIGQKVDDYTDLSFLRKENFDSFIDKIKELQLSKEEIERLRLQREQEINSSLVKLNNDIYQNEKGLSERDRVYLVAASIIATLGVPGEVAALEKSDLKSSSEEGSRDGDIILRKIKAFLGKKKLPDDKRKMIIRTLENTLTTDNINKPENGESQLKRVFSKIIDDLGIYYKIGLSTDFTGKLFNEMYSWLGFSQDKLNDVVLTPYYVATLLVKLARVNKDSYVWDFATGSAGLLVAAMNEMLSDAKERIKSQDELDQKIAYIKAYQLLGVELLPEIYMLAILNMILMGDGSSNIINEDSIREFNGNYGFVNKSKKFPATAFVLNPPYSAAGNGMIFVEKALSMMERGYAAIIIQNSAGSGKAIEYNKKILKHSTLLASIKMPIDLFLGKSSVQTYVYVFRVGEAHHKDDVVKFIDFSNDGYSRSNRKKASCNLRDTDRAKERYQEIVDLVRFGKTKLKIYTEEDYYEGTINPEKGNDWNQEAPRDKRITIDDLNSIIRNTLAWDFSSLFKNRLSEDAYLSVSEINSYELTNVEKIAIEQFNNIQWKSYNLLQLFGNSTRGKRLKSDDRIPGILPFVTAGEAEEGISAYIGNTVEVFNSNTTTIDMFGSAKYRNYKYGADDHVTVVHTEKLPTNASMFITAAIHKASHTGAFDYGRNFYPKDADGLDIMLPTLGDEPDFNLMGVIVSALQKLVIKDAVKFVGGTDLFFQKVAGEKNKKTVYDTSYQGRTHSLAAEPEPDY